MKILSEKELQIMNLLWDNGPMTVREMIGLMPEPSPHFNTVSTFVRLLEQYGFVNHEKNGNSFSYSAVVSRDSYNAVIIDNFIDTNFNGSPAQLLEAMVAHQLLTEDDLWDLMNRLRQAKK